MTFELFQRLMSFETKGQLCIEISFQVRGIDRFHCCWMGKMPDHQTKEDTFWYGLTPDGKNAYDYPTFEAFASANVFDGKSLSEIWDDVVIEDINGCDPMEMAEMYLSEKGGLGATQPCTD